MTENQNISNSTLKLIETYNELSVEYSKLENEIQEMKYVLNERNRDLLVPTTDVSSPLSKKFSSAFKETWRKIANLCHPDKTKNPVLHQIFINAKNAKESNNCFELGVYLAQALTELKSPCVNSADEDIKYGIEQLQLKIKKLKNSFLGNLLVIYKKDSNAASNLYRSGLSKIFN